MLNRKFATVALATVLAMTSFIIKPQALENDVIIEDSVILGEMDTDEIIEIEEVTELSQDLVIEDIDENNEVVEDIKEEAPAVAATVTVKNGVSNNTTWTIDSNGLLEITAKAGSNGLMQDNNYSQDSYFKAYKEIIKNIVINDCVSLPSYSAAYFAELPLLESINFINTDTSKATTMASMFKNTPKLRSINIADWDVSKVVNMSDMFNGASSLESLNLNKWNTTSLNYMNYMFANTSSLKNLQISNLDVSNVDKMNNLLNGSISLTDLDISEWNVSKVKDMNSMFINMKNLKKLDLSKWNTSNVTNMGYQFYGLTSLDSLDISTWDVSSVTTMAYMFAGANSLKDIDLSLWDVSNVTSLQSMFKDNSSLTELDLSKWNISNVTNTAYMFEGTSNISNLDLSNWNVTKVGKAQSMFKDSGLMNLSLNNWEFVGKAELQYMFSNMSNLDTLDLSNWNLSSKANTYYLFKDTPVKSLILGENIKFPKDPHLKEIEETDEFTGKWIHVEEPFDTYDSSSELINAYDGSKPGTYTWQKILTITYIVEEGATHSNPDTFEHGIGIDELLPAETEGKKFLGWLDENNEYVTDIDASEDDHIILEADFEHNHYNITYDLDGGTNHIDNPDSYEYGTGVEELYYPEKEGYTFMGWLDKDGNIITSITEDSMDDIHLKAVWENEQPQEPTETPDEKPDEKPEEIPDETPDVKPEEKPEEKPEQKPEIKPEEKPKEEAKVPNTGINNNNWMFIMTIAISLMYIMKYTTKRSKKIN